jgi:hypothetical protein
VRIGSKAMQRYACFSQFNDVFISVRNGCIDYLIGRCGWIVYRDVLVRLF